MVQISIKTFAIKPNKNAGGKKLLGRLALGHTKKRKARIAASPKIHRATINVDREINGIEVVII